MASFSLFYLYSAIVVMDFLWKNIGNVCMREGLIEKRLIPAPNLLIWGWLGSHIYHHSVFSCVLTTVFFPFHVFLLCISTLFMYRQYRIHQAFLTDAEFLDIIGTKVLRVFPTCYSQSQSTHIVAIDDFWRTSHHDGKKSALAGEGRGCTAHPCTPLSLLPSRAKLLFVLLLKLLF
jgi:hypothetical protein